MRVAVIGNGQSVHVVSRSLALAARGVSIRLVTLGPSLPAPGIEVRTRPIPDGPLASAIALAGFLRDVRSFQPDILHLHYAGGRLGSLALLSGVRPLVVNVMGGDVLPDQHPGGLSHRARRATRRILERADVVLVKSEALLPAVAALADVGARAHIVRWGVDPADFFPDAPGAATWRTKLELSPDAPIILSPRLLRPLYNIHLIVEGFVELAREDTRPVLVIAEYGADEEYRRKIEGIIESAELSRRVRFIGAVPHAEMRGLYSAASAVVMTPSSDGLPQSLMEALACGAPVLLGPLPAYSEIVENGRSALMVELNASAIAAGLGKLLSDPDLRNRLAQAGLAAVRERASLPADVERVVQIFESVRGGAHRTSRPDPWGMLLDFVGLARP
ncbi:MAG: glycosyltransferase family 4 protein [Vicinamibacteria bacterium]|jgi:glycosyltransferase involved in cell wall biosynthesis|nr:glycosyltransferase family 4 protein [Vicinamibacteria bacterium]